MDLLLSRTASLSRMGQRRLPGWVAAFMLVPDRFPAWSGATRFSRTTRHRIHLQVVRFTLTRMVRLKRTLWLVRREEQPSHLLREAAGSKQAAMCIGTILRESVFLFLQPIVKWIHCSATR